MDKDIQVESFEAAMKELEVLVKNLEAGQLTLAEAVAAYERGMFLQNYCKSKLEEAKLKIDMLTPVSAASP